MRTLAASIAAGLVLGALCAWPWPAEAYLTVTGLWYRIEEEQRPEDVDMVCHWARDLPPGTVLTEQDFYAVQVPTAWGYGRCALDALVGRRVTSPVLADERVREERLAPAPPTGQ